MEKPSGGVGFLWIFEILNLSVLFHNIIIGKTPATLQALTCGTAGAQGAVDTVVFHFILA